MFTYITLSYFRTRFITVLLNYDEVRSTIFVYISGIYEIQVSCHLYSVINDVFNVRLNVTGSFFQCLEERRKALEWIPSMFLKQKSKTKW